jgi:hypothetical protein
MLFMVIERFRSGHPRDVGERFKARGRLFPAGSPIAYVASWMTRDGTHCYQIMESPTRADLDPWLAQWSDLVEFEVHPVQTSPEYWAAVAG